MRCRTRNKWLITFRVIAAGIATGLTMLPLHSLLAQETTSAKTARVAVFGEPGFPSYLADNKATLPPPDAIVARLQSLGIPAEVVHAAALVDSSRFNASRYSLLVLPYGNCYPQAALQSLQTFHRENGGFVLTGIPFTRPVVLDPGAAEGWWAVPGWGNLVRVVPGGGQHGENAFLFRGRPDDWVGTNSPRFPVRAGQALRVSACFKDQGQMPVDESHLYLQFLDKDGYLISQTGFVLPYAPDWQIFSDTITAPDRTAIADVSPQISHDPHRELLMSGLSVVAQGQAIPINNGNLARVGDHWRDTGDGGKDIALFGPQGVGVGSFAGPDGNAKPYVAAPEDLLGIAPVGYTWNQTNVTPWLDPASLPNTDTIIPLVGTRDHPVAALAVHHSDDYRGVVDAWVYEGPGGEMDIAGTGQMIVRGVVAALKQQGRLSDARVKACYAVLDRLSGNKATTASDRVGKKVP